MYSILTENENMKRAKGVNKHIVENVLTLSRKIQTENMKSIRSESHQLYTLSMNKMALNPYDVNSQ